MADAPWICDCQRVDAARVEAALRAGARDVDAVARLTGAGTGCGTCRPEIRRRLRRHRLAAWWRRLVDR